MSMAVLQHVNGHVTLLSHLAPSLRRAGLDVCYVYVCFLAIL